MSRLTHSELNMVHLIGWLRAAVLGANDGLVSNAFHQASAAKQISNLATRTSRDHICSFSAFAFKPTSATEKAICALPDEIL